MKKAFFIGLIITPFILSGCAKKSEESKTIEEKVEVSVQTEPDTEQLTPEEVLTRMDTEEGVGLEQGPIEVEIISPEEEKFSPGQARMYEANISGLVTGSKARCTWKFYLNQYDEEALYQEMNDEKYAGDLCSFTSTFIRDRGDLRVHVDVEVTRNDQEGVIQTASSERAYRVE